MLGDGILFAKFKRAAVRFPKMLADRFRIANDVCPFENKSSPEKANRHAQLKRDT